MKIESPFLWAEPGKRDSEQASKELTSILMTSITRPGGNANDVLADAEILQCSKG